MEKSELHDKLRPQAADDPKQRDRLIPLERPDRVIFAIRQQVRHAYPLRSTYNNRAEPDEALKYPRPVKQLSDQ